jgi:hypothetical protein
MVKNKDILGSVDSNPYNFRHAIYVNGKQILNEGLFTDLETRRLPLWAIGQFSRRVVYTIPMRAIRLHTICSLTAISC